MKLIPTKIKLPNRKCLDPEYEKRPTPINMPKLHFLAVLYGSMGSGKSVALYNMIDMYDETKSFDRIIWVSPTMRRDVNGMEYLNNKKHNFELRYYEHFNLGEFKEELEGMKKDIDEYREYLHRMEIWKKFVSNGYDVDKMSLSDLIVLYDLDFEPPTTEFKNGFPCFAVVFDDVICEKGIFSQNIKNPVAKFFTTHRQHSCSIFMTSQVHQQGIPRQIRGVVSIWILFRCKSKELQESVAKELSFKCDKETLMKVWDFVTTSDPHDFLFVDYKQNDLNQMFRKNFNNLVQLEEIKSQ